jgi:RHS repeat-associated protein
VHYVGDALGSTAALTNAAGTSATTYTFEPFGRTEASGTLNPNPFQFTGRENDGTGLYYYRARYYDPIRSRFVTEDPLGLLAGTHFYAYAGDNPSRFFDPMGLRLEGIQVRSAETGRSSLTRHSRNQTGNTTHRAVGLR